MKTRSTILTGLFLILAGAPLWAGKPIPLEQLPPAVVNQLENYFPGAELLEAEQDRKRGNTEYEVTLRYKDLTLEVEVDENGKITDVDSDS